MKLFGNDLEGDMNPCIATAPHKYIKIATDRYYHVATEEVRSELATSGLGGRMKRFRI